MYLEGGECDAVHVCVDSEHVEHDRHALTSTDAQLLVARLHLANQRRALDDRDLHMHILNNMPHSVATFDVTLHFSIMQMSKRCTVLHQNDKLKSLEHVTSIYMALASEEFETAISKVHLAQGRIFTQIGHSYSPCFCREQ